jgi:alkylation response protein AidB-like acyl-CoA dehydrogenase
MKSAMSGKLALMPAIKNLMDDVMSGPIEKEEREGELADAFDLLASAKKTALFAAGVATQKYIQKLADEQEVMGALADMIIEVYAMESTLLRAQKMLDAGKPAPIPVAMANLYAAKAIDVVELAARRVIAAAAEGDMLKTQAAILRRLVKHDPIDTISLGRVVAAHMFAAGRYSL